MIEEDAYTPPPDEESVSPRAAEALLSASNVDDLFRDLTVCAQVQHIAFKQAPGQARAEPTPPDLAETRALLDRQAAHAVQVRYTYNGQLWIDTLTRQAGGYALLRVQHI